MAVPTVCIAALVPATHCHLPPVRHLPAACPLCCSLPSAASGSGQAEGGQQVAGLRAMMQAAAISMLFGYNLWSTKWEAILSRQPRHEAASNLASMEAPTMAIIHVLLSIILHLVLCALIIPESTSMILPLAFGFFLKFSPRPVAGSESGFHLHDGNKLFLGLEGNKRVGVYGLKLAANSACHCFVTMPPLCKKCTVFVGVVLGHQGPLSSVPVQTSAGIDTRAEL
ncbi:hypothetical protein GGX14DRAFT_384140 [Mycena pura]|uniref:Uncharacterized protein n=1 Tax=Mycena pura TaxID=153505 RepID=A0AAD7E6D6_9AGAR|nr:hypothetical protein GGX14DRAFT_384140 [Mycena pura]